MGLNSSELEPNFQPRRYAVIQAQPYAAAAPGQENLWYNGAWAARNRP